MKPLQGKPGWITLAVLAANLALGHKAVATEPAELAGAAPPSRQDAVQLAQITSVSELSDISPSDWAYQALTRLVEEYGCLEGYPDRTYRGTRALTRYEFAAGLNACLDVISQLIGSVDTADLDTIRRLQTEFAAELAALQGRVDVMEADVAELSANQFSTTTKLHAQLDTHLVVPLSNTNLADTSRRGTGAEQPTFEYRTRLNFDTSFTGADRLRIQLQASDQGNPRSVSAVSGGLAYQSGPTATDTGTPISDGVKLNQVYYQFPTGDRLSWTVAANGLFADDLVSSTILPFNGPSVARFGKKTFYEAIKSGAGNFALGANWSITDSLILDLGYLSGSAQNPDIGLFDQYQYIAQLNYLSNGWLDAAISYQDSSLSGDGTIDYLLAGLLNFKFGAVEVGGYYAYTPVQNGPNADSWQVGVAVNDAFGSGNKVGIYGGRTPNTFSSPSGPVPYVVEGYYQFSVNQFLSLTPAIIYGNLDLPGNSDGVYGVIRATFRY
jgi:hypothetical protein